MKTRIYGTSFYSRYSVNDEMSLEFTLTAEEDFIRLQC